MRISDWSSDVCSSDLSRLCDRAAGLCRSGDVRGLHGLWRDQYFRSECSAADRRRTCRRALSGQAGCLDRGGACTLAQPGYTMTVHGAADRSYGLAVAKLAGLPPPVIARAREVLKRLEAGRQASGGLAAGLDDLPLFAAHVRVDEDAPDALRERIAAIQPDAVTPREEIGRAHV